VASKYFKYSSVDSIKGILKDIKGCEILDISDAVSLGINE
jgi:hypothetical protein